MESVFQRSGGKNDIHQLGCRRAELLEPNGAVHAHMGQPSQVCMERQKLRPGFLLGLRARFISQQVATVLAVKGRIAAAAAATY